MTSMADTPLSKMTKKQLYEEVKYFKLEYNELKEENEELKEQIDEAMGYGEENEEVWKERDTLKEENEKLKKDNEKYKSWKKQDTEGILYNAQRMKNETRFASGGHSGGGDYIDYIIELENGISLNEEIRELKSKINELKSGISDCVLELNLLNSDDDDGIDDDTIVMNIKCNTCGNFLPPHTAKEHLDINNPIHKCPHPK